jgi:hypothetical protein
MSTVITAKFNSPDPIKIQPTAMTCNECKHEFMADLLVNCSIATAVAMMRGIECPECEAGHESLMMGHKPPVIKAPLEGSPEANVRLWMKGIDTGISSMTLAESFLGLNNNLSYRGKDSIGYPHDPADLGRCLRLIKRVPEVRERVDQLAKENKYWAKLAPRWDELAALMEEECGISGEKNGGNAPKTYQLMREIHEQG